MVVFRSAAPFSHADGLADDQGSLITRGGVGGVVKLWCVKRDSSGWIGSICIGLLRDWMHAALSCAVQEKKDEGVRRARCVSRRRPRNAAAHEGTREGFLFPGRVRAIAGALSRLFSAAKHTYRELACVSKEG